jgi:hypothetical protein
VDRSSPRIFAVRVKVRPVHSDNNRLSLSDDLWHPSGEHVPHDYALIGQQSVNLRNGVLSKETRAWAREWPMIDTVSDALVMTPSVPLAKDATRLA